MAKGNCIIVTPNPKGVFEEIIVVGTPKPGTIMYRTAASLVEGRFSMEPAGTTAALGMGADGDRIPPAVLLSSMDHMACPPGRAADEAYVSGERGCVYYPLPGEQVNVLFQNQSGTGDDVTVGMKMIVDDGTGKVLPTTGSPESEPFVALEAITDPTADQLLWCMASGV